jgi:hypothetical protein
VVIPFFNPAANIEDCLSSMLSQTLDRSRFEVLLVDDGSTDGSPARVARWVARHPELMSVQRIPASGWPGRPRNFGIDVARGRYIHFVDSDDSLAPRALERILEVADESAADVVVGKLSSDFRGVHQPLFRTTVTGRTLADYPIANSLTPHKLFRRDFLHEHGIRFAEGPRHVEDEHFCIQAYVHARSVAVIGDTACYFYRRRRTSGRNLGDTVLVPAEYYRDLGYVLDVIDSPAAAPAARANVQTRIYRTEMLGRLRGAGMLGYGPDYRAAMVDEVRRLAASRIPAEIHDTLPVLLRMQSALLRAGDIDGLADFAKRLETIRLRAVTTTPQWQDGQLMISVDAPLHLGDAPFRLERSDGGWVMPASLAPGLDASQRTLGAADDEDLDLDLVTISRTDSQRWSTTAGLTLDIDETGRPHVHGDVALDPWSLVGEASLSPGRWDLRLRISFAGVSRQSPLRPAGDPPPGLGTWVDSGDGAHSVAAYWTRPTPTLALDVDEWAHPLHDAVVDGMTEPARIAARRRLVVRTGDLRGRAGTTTSATLLLDPLDAGGLGPVACTGQLRLGPDGATLRARIPRLPSPAARWGARLRMAGIGGPPPRELPVELRQGRLGRLSVAETAAGD